MRSWPLKSFSFVYWELSQLFKSIYDDGLSEWKAMASLICAEIFVIMGVYGKISLLIGHRLLDATLFVSRLFCIVVVLAIVAANYAVLLFKNRCSIAEGECASDLLYDKVA